MPAMSITVNAYRQLTDEQKSLYGRNPQGALEKVQPSEVKGVSRNLRGWVSWGLNFKDSIHGWREAKKMAEEHYKKKSKDKIDKAKAAMNSRSNQLNINAFFKFKVAHKCNTIIHRR